MPNPPEIVNASDKAFYSPVADRITMPARGLFESVEEYWSTLWHEEGHYADIGIRVMQVGTGCD
jgi:antirestriction protein ArdC